MMTEAELQRLIAELCPELGLYHYHGQDSRRNRLADPGFPDSVIVGTRILFRELKSSSGQLSLVQRCWGSKIAAAGGDWAVWRPVDWHNCVIHRQLVKISPR